MAALILLALRAFQ